MGIKSRLFVSTAAGLALVGAVAITPAAQAAPLGHPLSFGSAAAGTLKMCAGEVAGVVGTAAEAGAAAMDTGVTVIAAGARRPSSAVLPRVLSSAARSPIRDITHLIPAITSTTMTTTPMRTAMLETVTLARTVRSGSNHTIRGREPISAMTGSGIPARSGHVA